MITDITPLLGKVHNCDCLEFMKQLPDKCVDLVLTDPPYGLNKKIHDGGTWATKEKFNACLEWDFKPPLKAFKEMFRISKNQIIWGGNYFTEFLPPSRGWIVWNKPYFPTMSDCELAWTSFDKNIKSITENRNADGYKEHPTQKSLNVFTFALRYAGEFETVFDPYMGSGTTAVACERLGRKWFGCELEPKYCEIANKRIEAEQAQGKLF